MGLEKRYTFYCDQPGCKNREDFLGGDLAVAMKMIERRWLIRAPMDGSGKLVAICPEHSNTTAAAQEPA